MQQSAQKQPPMEGLYLREKKKSKIFLTTTVALSALVIVLGAYIFSLLTAANSRSLSSLDPNQMPQEMGQPGQAGPGGRMGMSVENFLNDDGSVDTERIASMLKNMPSEVKDSFGSRIDEQINNAIKDGSITDAQATALKEAFGISGSASDGSI